MASDTATQTDGASPVERAEAIVDRLGERLSEARQGAAQAVSPAEPAPSTDRAGDERPATERADEMLTRTGEYLGHWMASVSRQVRRAAALAREEAEDIWAEAQAIRRGETVSELPPLETPPGGVPF
ncbi:MAG: hypothetical protein JO250_01260 [Armatimonadetes bacterium]|nr:hypothetical protein [Armatimonadota bacterium]